VRGVGAVCLAEDIGVGEVHLRETTDAQPVAVDVDRLARP
jgi:hypothetical protein